MQPLIGPVLTNGLAFQYYDVNGNPTAVRTQVARIDITVRARTTAAVRSGGQAPAATGGDSIVTSVALRNNRRVLTGVGGHLRGGRMRRVLCGERGMGVAGAVFALVVGGGLGAGAV